TVNFSGDVNAGDFALSDFVSQPTNEFPDTIIQTGPTGLLLTFANDIDTDTELTYSGDVMGLLTPQTIVY
ncbi:MAG: hypothetical protein WAP47_06945, partial [Candidatus Rokuibacteriota bacterium]